MEISNYKKSILLFFPLILILLLISIQYVNIEDSINYDEIISDYSANVKISNINDSILWTTDIFGNIKIDFKPGEIVYIHGSNFVPESIIELNLTRPDDIIEFAPDGRFISDLLPVTDQNGDFFFYEYDLNGIEGEYLIQASDCYNIVQFIFFDSSVWTTDGFAQQKNKFTSGEPVGLDGEGLTPNATLYYEIKDEPSDGNNVSWGWIDIDDNGEILFAIIWDIPVSYSKIGQHKVYVFDSQTKTKTFSIITNSCIDLDGDGYYSWDSNDCPDGDDCDDSDDTVYPGAPEICDGKDNDCDGEIDEGVEFTYYLDSDEDGFGDPYVSITIGDCPPPEGYVIDNTDCDDSDDTVYPGAPEICDGKDNDCDGEIDEGVEFTYYLDSDEDGFGDPDVSITIGDCPPPEGYVIDNTDCDDSDDTVYPGAPEICDGKDNDCDGEIDEGVEFTYYLDSDEDGFGDPDVSITIGDCPPPEGYVIDNTDCDDSDDTVYPGAPEICDGKDNDCDGEIDEGVEFTYYLDSDEDGFGDPDVSITIGDCPPPEGYVIDNTDCDDSDDTVYPGAPELFDGKDNNCDGIIDEVLLLYVDDDANPTWYDFYHVRTIQEAINNASVGAEIFVYNGTYTGIIIVDKTVTITGENQDNVLVSGSFYVYSSNVIIEKMTIFNIKTGDFPSGIYDESSNSIYRNLYLLNNTHGIQLTIISINIIISDNLFEDNNYGIYSVESSSFVLIKNNIFKDNTFGILIENSEYYTIFHNKIINNTEVGLLIISSNNNLIYDNLFDNLFNVDMDGGTNNIWNVSKIMGVNIIRGPYIGGNYWNDYTGMDLDGDGIGDSVYYVVDSDLFIDYLPLTENINQPPILGNPKPADGSFYNPLELIWSIQINDTESGVFDWNISCSNGQYNYSFESSNGTKTLHLSSLSYGTSYKIWVKVFDYYRWTNETFTFTTKKKNVIVNIPPVAIIDGFFIGFPGEIINFDGSQSFDPDGYITKYEWDLDDNTLLEGQNVNHSYSKPGNYNVTLTVFDNYGATDINKTNVIIIKANNPPELNLTIIKLPDNQTVNLTITVFDKDGDNITCIINWDDNSTPKILQLNSNQTIIETYTYSENGTYNIQVTADDGSTITTETKEITILKDKKKKEEKKNGNGGNHSSNILYDIIQNNEPFDEPFLDNKIDSRSILGDHLDKNYAKIIATILSIILLFLLNYLVEFFSDYFSERTIEYRKNWTSRFFVKKAIVAPPSTFLSIKEIIAIIASTLILSSVLTWTWVPDLSAFLETFIVFVLIVLVIIFIREALRAFLCSRLKFNSEYYVWPLGAMMMFVSTAIGNTFSLSANHHYNEEDIKKCGRVSFIVSIILYVIVAIAFITNIYYPSTIIQMIIIVTILNLFIDLFPLNPMDGYEVRHWNLLLWLSLYIIVIISYVVVYFNLYP